MVKNNWKNEPKTPRTDVSAISDTNIGRTTQAAPVAIPAKNLPAQSMVGLLANIIRAQLIVNGIPKDIDVYFLPIFSAKIPLGSAPKRAPIARNEPIHVPGKKKKMN